MVSKTLTEYISINVVGEALENKLEFNDDENNEVGPNLDNTG